MVYVNLNVKLNSLNPSSDAQKICPILSYQELRQDYVLQVFTNLSEEHMGSILPATLGMLVAYSFEKLVCNHHNTSRHNLNYCSFEK